MAYTTIIKVRLERHLIVHLDYFKGKLNRANYIKKLIEKDLREQNKEESDLDWGRRMLNKTLCRDTNDY